MKRIDKNMYIYFIRNNKIPTPKALMRTNSVTPNNEYKRQLTRLESNKSK